MFQGRRNLHHGPVFGWGVEVGLQCVDNSPSPGLWAQLAHLFGLFKDGAGFIPPLLPSPALSDTALCTSHHVSSCSTQKPGETLTFLPNYPVCASQ